MTRAKEAVRVTYLVVLFHSFDRHRVGLQSADLLHEVVQLPGHLQGVRHGQTHQARGEGVPSEDGQDDGKEDDESTEKFQSDA